MAKHNISTSVIKRLPRYYRFLGELIAQNCVRISSRELSEMMDLTASQIRQDLNCFGGFGQQGYGYNVVELRQEIGKILGVNKSIEVILIGAGNLGKAIASHLDFKSRGCQIVGIFDINRDIIGEEVNGIKISHLDEFDEFLKTHDPKIAILCIPKANAQEVADMLIKNGIKGFWNFSHYDLRLDHKDVIVENVHLGDSLLTLTYSINNAE